MGKYLKCIDDTIKEIREFSKLNNSVIFHIKTSINEKKERLENKLDNLDRIILFTYYINNENDIIFFEELVKTLHNGLINRNISIYNHTLKEHYKQDDSIHLYIEYYTED
jgi:hypothetical protein